MNRKRIDVDMERVRELAKDHNGLEISEILGVSKDVIYSRLREFDIKTKSQDSQYELLENLDTSQYSIKELAKMCNVSYKAMSSKLFRCCLPFKGMKADPIERTRNYSKNNGYNPAAATMKNIKAKSKLIIKEAEAREKGMHYADLQKAETLKMFGRVEI